MRKNLLLVLAFLLCCISIKAQQIARSSLFNGTQFAWNPAQTGLWKYMELNANYFQHWARFEGSPRQLALGLQYPFDDLNMGLGIHLIQDEAGPFQHTGISLAYAYHIPLNNYKRLSIGILARSSQYRYDASGEIAVDPDDPLLSTQIATTQYLNAGAGIQYTGADSDEWLENHFFAGIGVFQAIPQDLIFSNLNAPSNFKREWHAYAQVGYRFDLESAFIEPSAQLDYAYQNIFLPRFQILFEMHDTFWIGSYLDGGFNTGLQLGYIFTSYSDWNIRLGAFAGGNPGILGPNIGASYGLSASFQFER